MTEISGCEMPIARSLGPQPYISSKYESSSDYCPTAVEQREFAKLAGGGQPQGHSDAALPLSAIRLALSGLENIGFSMMQSLT